MRFVFREAAVLFRDLKTSRFHTQACSPSTCASRALWRGKYLMWILLPVKGLPETVWFVSTCVWLGPRHPAAAWPWVLVFLQLRSGNICHVWLWVVGIMLINHYYSTWHTVGAHSANSDGEGKKDKAIWDGEWERACDRLWGRRVRVWEPFKVKSEVRQESLMQASSAGRRRQPWQLGWPRALVWSTGGNLGVAKVQWQLPQILCLPACLDRVCKGIIHPSTYLPACIHLSTYLPLFS